MHSYFEKRSGRNSRFRSRFGRSIAVWITGATATVAAGGMLLPLASNSDRDAAKNGSNASIVYHSESPSGNASVGASSPIDVQLPPSGSSANPSDVLQQPVMTPGVVRAERSGDLPSTQDITPKPSSAAPGETSSSEDQELASAPQPAEPAPDRSKVELYYATDRSEILPWSLTFWFQSIATGTLALVGTFLTVCGLIRYQQKFVWTLGVLGCVALCGIVATKARLRYTTATKMVDMGGVIFGGKRNDTQLNDVIQYGRALVTLPPNHQVGKVERPNTFLFEYEESPDKHVMLRQMCPLEKSQFFESVDKSIEKARLPSMMLFIHGYNVPFDDALLRTAQLASDLEFDGVPMLYSWPSTGRPSGYLVDEGNVEWSVTHLEELLHEIKTRTKVERLHVIVHSMGNRALLGAVERLTLRYPKLQPMLEQVVLAAPDVDVGQFESRYLVPIHQAAKQVTLYTSSGDRALLASATIHQVQRLGMSSATTYRGIDTVDVSKIDTSMLGHSYYGSKETLIKDIRALIELGEPPLQRSWLQEVASKAEPKLWRFAEAIEASTANTQR